MSRIMRMIWGTSGWTRIRVARSVALLSISESPRIDPSLSISKADIVTGCTKVNPAYKANDVRSRSAII